MSNIRYNEQEEAFELPYKLWNNTMTVRFYTDAEDTIMKKLKYTVEQAMDFLEVPQSKRQAVAGLVKGA